MSIRNTLAASLVAAMAFTGVQAAPASAVSATEALAVDEITADVISEEIGHTADSEVQEIAEDILEDAFEDDLDIDNGALNDRDGDGIPDAWEIEGVTLSDGTKLALPEYGADPDKKDLFLQLNWMASEYETLGCGEALSSDSQECAKANTRSYRPSAEILDQLVDLFAKHDINLHIDAGAAYTNMDNYGTFFGGQTMDYTQYFFGGTKQAVGLLTAQTELLGARDAVFRVGIIGDQMDARDYSTGAAVVGGNVFYVANSAKLIRGQEELRNTILHEFGHNLGLRHNGHRDYVQDLDNGRMHPGYNSVMSYTYQMRHFDYSTEEYTRTDNGQTRTIPADWDVLALSNATLGSGDHKVGATVDNAAVAEASKEKARAAEAAANNGKAMISVPAGQGAKYNVGETAKIAVEVTNPGLDLATYTIAADFAGGAQSKAVTLRGALSGNNTAEVVFEIPVANMKAMPVNLTVTNGAEVVASTVHSVKVADAEVKAMEGIGLEQTAPAAGKDINIAAIIVPVVIALLAALGAGFAMMNR